MDSLEIKIAEQLTENIMWFWPRGIGHVANFSTLNSANSNFCRFIRKSFQELYEKITVLLSNMVLRQWKKFSNQINSFYTDINLISLQIES